VDRWLSNCCSCRGHHLYNLIQDFSSLINTWNCLGINCCYCWSPVPVKLYSYLCMLYTDLSVVYWALCHHYVYENPVLSTLSSSSSSSSSTTIICACCIQIYQSCTEHYAITMYMKIILLRLLLLWCEFTVPINLTVDVARNWLVALVFLN
jgi:hypothetical protein